MYNWKNFITEWPVLFENVFQHSIIPCFSIERLYRLRLVCKKWKIMISMNEIFKKDFEKYLQKIDDHENVRKSVNEDQEKSDNLVPINILFLQTELAKVRFNYFTFSFNSIRKLLPDLAPSIERVHEFLNESGYYNVKIKEGERYYPRFGVSEKTHDFTRECGVERFLLDKGYAEVLYNINDKKSYNLHVSTLQMCLLNKLEEKEFLDIKDIINFRKIESHFPFSRFSHHITLRYKLMKSLLQLSGIVIFENLDPENPRNWRCFLNPDFSSEEESVRNDLSLPEDLDQFLHSEKSKRLFPLELNQVEIVSKYDDLDGAVQAAIVKMMKKSGSIACSQLIPKMREEFEESSFSMAFPNYLEIDESLWKYEIAFLIDKEYIEKKVQNIGGEDIEMYIYCP